MAFRISTDLKNNIVNEIINTVAGTAGTAGTASIIFYTGSQPTVADDAATGTVLGTISDVTWDECTGGTSALTAILYGTMGTSGTAGWARAETKSADGTYRMDGDVGTGGAVFLINSPVFSTSGAVVALLTAPIYMG